MKYLSDHARIVILEKKLEQLAAIVTANIVNSGRAVRVVGQVVENTPVNTEKTWEPLTAGDSLENWSGEKNRKILQHLNSTPKTCAVHNSLRNPKELS